MNKNILITGALGQLGSELAFLSTNDEYVSNTYYLTDKDDLDITNKSVIENFCKKNKIDTIINCAAYTAVDHAENDLDMANRINYLAVKYMSEIAKEQAIQIVHISTDYIFDGTNYKPYLENDITNPQSVYGKTKLDGENILKEINPFGSIIIRTSWVYSSFGNNFVKTMLKLGQERDELGIIFDQVGTPTYARDLASAILKIIHTDIQVDKSSVEVFHFSNEGACSWYDFANAIFDMKNITCDVTPINTEEYPTPAKRPYYSVLDKQKIKSTYSIHIPYWRDSLQFALKQL